MSQIQKIYTDNAEEWNKHLSKMQLYDFYHLPSYHKIAEEGGEGKAVLFSYEKDGYHIALPLMIRSLKSVDELSGANGFYDASSVYGYAGPVSSHSSIPDEIVKDFQSSLQSELKNMNVITVFSRLHPFIPQNFIIENTGSVSNIGITISVDLSLPVEEQRSQYSKGHKSGVNKLRRLGAECIIDTEYKYLDEFLALYYETMNRVNATDYYYFTREHFENLVNKLEANVYLFICLLEGEVICGGIYIECNGIVQSYLGGMFSKYRDIAPRKLEKDTVRLWAAENKFKTFHLGGGVGAQKDSLFEFKSGFSKIRHDFNVWKWVIDKEKYIELCNNRDIDIKSDLYNESFFPAYRTPLNSNSET